MYETPKPENIEFSTYWNKFIIIIAKKEGFNEIALKNLEILCDLYTNYDDLTKQLIEEGWTIVNETRYGLQHKSHPAAGERTKILADIRHYSKLLGVKVGTVDHQEDEDDDWT